MTIHSTALNEPIFTFDTTIRASREVQASDGVQELHRTLCSIAKNAVSRTLTTGSTFDPILGAATSSVSLGGKIQKQHGLVLPAALAAVLEFHGLSVYREQPVQISTAGWCNAENNSLKNLKLLNSSTLTDNHRLYRADILVFDPKTGHGVVMDGKRGCGNADTSSREMLIRKLKAAYCTLPDWANKALDISILLADVRILDFYGQSGYQDEIKICGSDLDAYFGLEIEMHMAVFNRAFARYTKQVWKIAENTEVQSSDDDIHSDTGDTDDLDRFRFPVSLKAAAQDLFQDDLSAGPSIANFDDSLAAARQRLRAVKAR